MWLEPWLKSLRRGVGMKGQGLHNGFSLSLSYLTLSNLGQSDLYMEKGGMMLPAPGDKGCAYWYSYDAGPTLFRQLETLIGKVSLDICLLRVS